MKVPKCKIKTCKIEPNYKISNDNNTNYYCYLHTVNKIIKDNKKIIFGIIKTKPRPKKKEKK